ncbi:hypothetical protein NBRC10512_000789 [Rhodotorula toruloides]|uniref:RHTO0S06e08834g1_1 n=2 Tax=Rhodotorula toruloides TaxID=5286 RepID=A0A061AWX3_RHOTO|nr:uncharacterized protein RHTO_06379 [Rhodotorula toruloides NP11]EMS24375.1 hypothetical protein RHTO_06379 [Rhodotorula toruloides NP11]CDR42019.1 RHTO0S06e08834g1_1 [Rhodotorula toruloides]
MLTWCTKKMSSHHNRHYRLLDTHAEPAPRAAYVPSVAAVEAARRRMEEQSRRPALPRSAFRVGSREQMPPPPPPKDEPPAWPTRKSSRDALNPPEVDYKRSSTASTWGRNLVKQFQEEAPPLPQEGVIPIGYRPEPHNVHPQAEELEEERDRRHRLRRQDRHTGVERTAEVVHPGTAAFLRPKMIDVSRSRSPPVFKHQQR